MKQISLLLATLLLTACAAVGSGSGFYGLPDNGSRTMGDESPRVDPRLADVVTITPVRFSDIGTYEGYRASGRIIAEQQRDGYLYFAVKEPREVRTEDKTTTVFVVERYKVPVR